MIRIWVLIAALLAAPAALADAPANSLRPVPKGGEAMVQPVEVTADGSFRQPQAAQERARSGGLLQSLRPLFRSRKVEQKGRAQRKLREKGAVCGDINIQGEVLGRVAGRLSGCGVENAVRVRNVSDVSLSTGAVMDCRTAAALKTWMERSAKPALARKGGGLRQIRVAAHYACRTRNNQRGARISEHGKGRAIDISAFLLRDGQEVSVLQGWNNRSYSKALRQMHQGACGPFGTVLGPNANKFHRDHFHFDTARYRSGSYCK